MSDFNRSMDLSDDEERLPWLEPVDEYDDEGGISIARLIGAVVVGLVALGLVIGGVFWLRNRDNAGGDGTLIAAPDGPVKEAPEQPGGMKVEGAGDVAYGASVGKDVNSSIDLSALPEPPVTEVAPVTPAPKPAVKAALPAKPAKTQTAAVEAAPPPKPVVKPAPKPVAPKPAATFAAAAGGASVQLGAFSSEASANKAWKQLSGRFGFLTGLDHGAVAVSVGDKTLYRLRANAAGQAGTICAKLKVAGEACSVVN